mmetsp:Transcript_9811/g.13824  ORF Transcript_9811/g.13824 Transcript_9811/m.13824 type:complete len:81 (-) Transcript_9811:34-276(-)
MKVNDQDGMVFVTDIQMYQFLHVVVLDGRVNGNDSDQYISDHHNYVLLRHLDDDENEYDYVNDLGLYKWDPHMLCRREYC